jgi:hypothetical protein
MEKSTAFLLWFVLFYMPKASLHSPKIVASRVCCIKSGFFLKLNKLIPNDIIFMFNVTCFFCSHENFVSMTVEHPFGEKRLMNDELFEQEEQPHFEHVTVKEEPSFNESTLITEEMDPVQMKEELDSDDEQPFMSPVTEESSLDKYREFVTVNQEEQLKGKKKQLHFRYSFFSIIKMYYLFSARNLLMISCFILIINIKNVHFFIFSYLELSSFKFRNPLFNYVIRCDF